MSYITWKSIRNGVLSGCAVAEASVKLGHVTGDSFGLSDDYNELLNSDLERVFSFINQNTLSAKLDVSRLQRRFERRFDTGGGFGSGLPGIASKFSALRIIIEKIDRLYDQELSTVSKVEHALLVLDRKTFLLEDVRSRWNDAFSNSSEVKLEELGGLHLFEFGIWAFKASGHRAETDLILQQTVEAGETTAPLVMTEWKKASSLAEAKTKINEAVKQCQTYGDGVLKPLQIDKHRFIVVVTKEPVAIKEDREVDGIRYLIRNFAVERQTPAAEAKKK